MLNISGINNGVVLDHIQAGKSMDIYHYLNLQELDCQVAIIKNAKSSKMGRKDIIKIEGSLDLLDLENPRCITSIEQELPHVFDLTDEENKVYRCIYCETKHR